MPTDYVTEFYVWLILTIVYVSAFIITGIMLIVRKIQSGRKMTGRASGMIGVEQKLISKRK